MYWMLQCTKTRHLEQDKKQVSSFQGVLIRENDPLGVMSYVTYGVEGAHFSSKMRALGGL